MIYDVIVIGGGPAGLTAAVYARRAGKSVLVIEKASFGGQITWSPKVENFPGTISISGTELGDRLLAQAMEQGAEVELEEVNTVRRGAEKGSAVFALQTGSGSEFTGRTVIFCGGAKPRRTGLPGEEELIGNGVCFCAVCDGAFYQGKDAAVLGGGNSALQDAMLLSEKCSTVYLIHRRDTFRGETALVKALKEKSNVKLLLRTALTGLVGDRTATEKVLTGIEVEQDGIRSRIPVSGLFVAVGHEPDNRVVSELADLDEAGYIRSGEDCLTKTPGLFAAGDCRTKSVRQVTTACADGAAAALAACHYLDTLN